MFGFDDSQNAYDQVQSGNHASLSHEAIAAAASFEVRTSPPFSQFMFNSLSIRVGHEGIRESSTQGGRNRLTWNRQRNPRWFCRDNRFKKINTDVRVPLLTGLLKQKVLISMIGISVFIKS